jgi:hypothetical protein
MSREAPTIAVADIILNFITLNSYFVAFIRYQFDKQRGPVWLRLNLGKVRPRQCKVHNNAASRCPRWA